MSRAILFYSKRMRCDAMRCTGLNAQMLSVGRPLTCAAASRAHFRAGKMTPQREFTHFLKITLEKQCHLSEKQSFDTRVNRSKLGKSLLNKAEGENKLIDLHLLRREGDRKRR